MDLTQFARKYIWWLPPGEAVENPHRVIVQVMNLGTFEDAEALRQLVGQPELARALHDAQPGEFSPRSWHYWHLTLGLAPVNAVPVMPVRKYP